MNQIKCFWPWQDEKEEQWLNDQSQNGFACKSIHYPFTYQFDQISADGITYHLDALDTKKEDLREFMTTRNKAGWLYIGTMHGWHYFANHASKVSPVLGDAIGNHKKEKYIRQMGLLARLFPIVIIWFPIAGRSLSSPLFEVTAAFAVIAGIIYSWLTYKTYQRLTQLRKQFQ
jgi:hypothetical protein